MRRGRDAARRIRPTGGQVGGVCSAVPEDLLPGPAERPAFAGYVRRALPQQDSYTEHVRISVLTGRYEGAYEGPS